MPLLPLIDHSAAPNSWHQVRRPGGYELWHLHARAATGGIRLVVDFSQGSPFHPEYLHCHKEYLADPTRKSPVLPQEYSCVDVTLYRNNEPVIKISGRFSAFHFEASTGQEQMTIGPNRLTLAPDSLKLELNCDPADPSKDGLTAQLVFTQRVRHSPIQIPIFSSSSAVADHFWSVTHPLCEVQGEICIGKSANARTEKILFLGEGYQDHLYGSSLPGVSSQRWTRGLVLLALQSVAFQMSDLTDDDPNRDAHIVVADDSEIRVIQAPLVAMNGQRRTAWGLTYPTAIDMDRGLVLRQPRVIDSSPIAVKLVYEAFWEGNPVIAYCEMMSLHRMDWPGIRGKLLQDMNQRSQ
jgi:hypothetical protein